MALCGLCASIPFKNLQLLQSCWHPTFDEEDLQIFVRSFSEEPFKVGFPHQASLEALEASASACVLCSLLSDSVHKLIAAYKEHKKDPAFGYSDHYGLPLDYRLWLNKRTDGGDGFLAFTVSQHAFVIYLVAGIGFCVNEEDRLAPFITGRPVEQNAASQKPLERVVQWVRRCSDSHSGCYVKRPSMPLRVLDVDDDSVPSKIRLCEPKDLYGYYIALSHCWGNATPFTTQSSSMRLRKQGIQFDVLPKTFQDAVCITRKLGVRYLWIDSLCICQDDNGDWERESANMASVYSNSYLTIAATGAQGDSSGCFIPRPNQEYVEFAFTSEEGVKGHIQAYILSLRNAARYGSTLEMKKEPLTGRAWALQERTLARRTLHYATDQMYFECKESLLSEDGIHITGRYHNMYGPSTVSFFQRDFSIPINNWYELLWDYGRRKLTKPSDKLPAISGLTKIFEQQLQDDYVVGLWRKTLVEDLLWQTDGGKAAVEYRAPSWSWAAIDGGIGMGLQWKSSSIATIVDYHIEVKGYNPYGEVTNAWLKVRAPVIPLVPLVPLFVIGDPINIVNSELEKDNLVVLGPNCKFIRLRTEHGESRGGRALFDVIDGHEEKDIALIKKLSLFLLVLVQGRDEDEAGRKYKKDKGFQGLIITPVTESTSFKRLGVISFPGSLSNELKSMPGTGEWPVVTLI